jgi:hypothetical protein
MLIKHILKFHQYYVFDELFVSGSVVTTDSDTWHTIGSCAVDLSRSSYSHGSAVDTTPVGSGVPISIARVQGFKVVSLNPKLLPMDMLVMTVNGLHITAALVSRLTHVKPLGILSGRLLCMRSIWR